MRLVLASASPRRRELLGALGLSFDVAPAGVAETPGPGEPAERYVERVAREKAAAVARQSPECLVLAADTEVVLADRILGKPRDAGDARAMLEQLSGREHRVMTAVALDGAWKGACRVETRVAFAPLSAEQIGWYVSTGEPLDKAGAYAIQGLGGALIQRIEGSVTNVIGLPLVETLDLLQRAGLTLPWRAA